MKKLLIYLAGCGNKETITGNWCTCSRDGSYYELYFSDDSLVMATESGNTYSFKYEIRNDSLFYLDNYGEKPVEIKAKVIFHDKENMRLESGEYGVDYQKLPDNINKSDFRTRLLSKRCPDLRTDEEIKADRNRVEFVYFEF